MKKEIYFGKEYNLVRKSIREFVKKEIILNIDEWVENNRYQRGLPWIKRVTFLNAGDCGLCLTFNS